MCLRSPAVGSKCSVEKDSNAPPSVPCLQLSREPGRAGWMTGGPRVYTERGRGVFCLVGRPRRQADGGISCFPASPARCRRLAPLHQQRLSGRGLSSRRAQVPNAAVKGSCRSGPPLMRDKARLLENWLVLVAILRGTQPLFFLQRNARVFGLPPEVMFHDPLCIEDSFSLLPSSPPGSPVLFFRQGISLYDNIVCVRVTDGTGKSSPN